jgi:hypothetical protein
MRYFIVTFLIVSIATHAAFAHRGSDARSEHVEEYEHRRTVRSQFLKALREKNREIEAAVLTIEEIEEKIDSALKIQNATKLSSMVVVPLALFAGVTASRSMAIDGATKAARLTRILSVAGGTLVPTTGYFIYKIQQDKIESLSVLLTKEKIALKEEHAANSAVLEASL